VAINTFFGVPAYAILDMCHCVAKIRACCQNPLKGLELLCLDGMPKKFPRDEVWIV